MARALHALRLGLSLLQRRRHALRSEVLSELRTCVLIVVDDRLAGRHLARLLKAKGYERVRVVRRAASALLLAEKCSPRIVFLDVALSDDAYELANTLRQHAGRRTLRLIALTSSRSVLDTSVTFHTDDIGNTLAANGLSAHSKRLLSWSKNPKS